MGNVGVNKADMLGLSVIEKCCEIWSKTKTLRTFNLARNVIKLQIDQMEGNIHELKMQIALSQLFQASREACEKAKAKVEEETGESCKGCCITKIGIRMSRKGGQSWFETPYGPSGRIVSIDLANGWFTPKPCKNAVSGFDYEDSIYDSSSSNELEEKLDM